MNRRSTCFRLALPSGYRSNDGRPEIRSGAKAREGGVQVRSTFPYRTYQEFRKANQTLDDLFACAPQGQVNVVAGDRAELATALIASGNYFTVLGVHALESYVLTPIIQRQALEIPPATLFAFQILLGTVFGIWGLALALPLIAIAKVIIDHFKANDASAQPA